MFRKIGSIFSGKLMPRLAYPVLKGPLKGLKFILGSMEGSGGGATVYFNMIENEQTKIFTQKLKKGDIFFDVGANVGYYTMLASRLIGDNGKVISVEPVVRNIAYLHRHVAANKLKNVSIVPAACSDKIALVSFSEGPNSAMGHIAEKKVFDIDETKSTITLISTITIDSIIEKLQVNPTVIKIDVEGAEADVLAGMQNLLKQQPPVIFLSIHSDDLRKTCLAYLEKFNYNFQMLSSEKNILFEFLCTPTGNK